MAEDWAPELVLTLTPDLTIQAESAGLRLRKAVGSEEEMTAYFDVVCLQIKRKIEELLQMIPKPDS